MTASMLHGEAASQAANKQMQRARTGYKVVLCLAHRRVADLQRSAATMRYRALSDSASTRAEESDSESAESRQKR
jgi:hypothetical protein